MEEQSTKTRPTVFITDYIHTEDFPSGKTEVVFLQLQEIPSFLNVVNLLNLTKITRCVNREIFDLMVSNRIFPMEYQTGSKPEDYPHFEINYGDLILYLQPENDYNCKKCGYPETDNYSHHFGFARSHKFEKTPDKYAVFTILPVDESLKDDIDRALENVPKFRKLLNDAFGNRELKESENIKKRFEMPCGICVCGHSGESHYYDPEESASMPCQDANNNGDLCPCKDYLDSGNGDIYEDESVKHIYENM